jgi:hypothetical protein
MALQWELWDLDSANQLNAFETEAEALAFVHELLSLGWKADELTLLFEDESGPVEELPPALTGDELARRVASLGAPNARRTA